MKNIIFLNLAFLLTIWRNHNYMLYPHTYAFALCQASAAMVGCWAMIVIDDVKKCLRDKDE